MLFFKPTTQNPPKRYQKAEKCHILETGTNGYLAFMLDLNNYSTK